MEKGEFRGNCQICGAVQVVNAKGEMAKHGYTVDGVFHGVCSGADQLPLQVNRNLLDYSVERQINRACAYGQHASKLIAGEVTPVMVRKLTQWGSPVSEYKVVGNRKQYVPVHVSWEDAGERERVKGLKEDIQNAQRAEEQCRRTAQWLLELADMVHGKPLIDRAQEELELVRERSAKKAPIEGAYRTKKAQKDALEVLSRQYSAIRRVILDRYLAEKDEHLSHQERFASPGGQMYDQLPFDLHNWRAKHSTLVTNAYPDMADLAREIEGLTVAREVIKSRPVIK
jgi:hypothetical protein